MNLKKKNGFLFYDIRKTVYQKNQKTIQSHEMIGKENSFLFSMKLGCQLTLKVDEARIFDESFILDFLGQSDSKFFKLYEKLTHGIFLIFFCVKLDHRQFHGLGVMLADFQFFVNLLFQKIKTWETWLSCHYSQIIWISLSTVCFLLHLDFGNPYLENPFLWLKFQMAFRPKLSIIMSKTK